MEGVQRSNSGPVHVSGYTQSRNGHQITVRDYDRSRAPSAPPGVRSGSAEPDLGPFADVRRREECEIQAQIDEARCRTLIPPDARARCYSSANARYGACTNGQPLPPLVTW